MDIENVSEYEIQSDDNIILLSDEESDMENESKNSENMAIEIDSESEIVLIDNEIKRGNLYVEKDGIVIIMDDEENCTGSTTAISNQKELDEKKMSIEVEKNVASTSRNTNSSLMAELVNLDDKAFVENTEVFTCPVCCDKIKLGQGVMLKECLHLICKICLEKLVQFSEELFVRCPHLDEMHQQCVGVIQEREIKALVVKNVYEKFLEKSIRTAENTMQDSFHCRTANCQGWCTYEPLAGIFECPVCLAVNCLKCQVIHTNISCSEYEDSQRCIKENDATQEIIKAQLKEQKIMYCPTCQALIEKITGCDGIICTICKTAVCWATRGPRWGPKGSGDISGGCRCRINGKLCHPSCTGCH